MQEEVAALEALVEEPDPQIEAWKETLSDIEDGMSVGNTLRTLDDLSQQIEQRREEAMDAVSEAMEALIKATQRNCPNLLSLYASKTCCHPVLKIHSPDQKMQTVIKSTDGKQENGSGDKPTGLKMN